MTTPDRTPPRPAHDEHAHAVRLLHTSDCHVGAASSLPQKDGRREAALDAFDHVMRLVPRHEIDAVLIAGDFFDNHRVKRPMVQAVAEILEAARVPVVILPGNHDPYMDEGVYIRDADLFPANVHVIGSAEGELILLEDHGLQVWGQAHMDYYDFRPAAVCPAWRHHPDRHLWRVAMAHGYMVRDGMETRYSYQIEPEELHALDAHYIALGHIDVHEDVGPDGVHAYYPGAPRHTGGATIVDLSPDGIAVQHVLHGGRKLSDEPPPLAPGIL